MNIIEINIAKDLEAIIKYKTLINQSLIEQKTIEEEMNLDQFIDYMDFTKNIFMDKATDTIPFCIYNLDEENILFFYTSVNDDIKDKCLSALHDINFNLSLLEHRSTIEMLEEDLQNGSFFIIGGEFYKKPKSTSSEFRPSL